MTIKRLSSILVYLSVFTVAVSGMPVRVHATAADVRDWVIPGGHFYTQTNGIGEDSDLGYAVVNDDAAQMWTWFKNLGGLPALGYPVSHRFEHDGFVAQAFQKAILLWDEEAQTVHLMNLFDELSALGADPFLEKHRFIPASEAWVEDEGQPWPDIVANHIALLDRDPAIAAAYYAERERGRDPITYNGLPMGLRDYGFVVVLRAQRRAFQHWQIETPWARAGEVVVVNGGDLAKELNLIPEAAQLPGPAPVPPFGYGDRALGEALYRDAGCILCHGLAGKGGIGPALLGTELDFATFLSAVRAPADTMPPYLSAQITDQEVRDIMAYVLFLAAKP